MDIISMKINMKRSLSTSQPFSAVELSRNFLLLKSLEVLCTNSKSFRASFDVVYVITGRHFFIKSKPKSSITISFVVIEIDIHLEYLLIYQLFSIPHSSSVTTRLISDSQVIVPHWPARCTDLSPIETWSGIQFFKEALTFQTSSIIIFWCLRGYIT